MKIRCSSSEHKAHPMIDMIATKLIANPDALWNILGLSDVLKCLLWVKGIQYSSYLGFITSENDRLFRAQKAGPLNFSGAALANIAKNFSHKLWKERLTQPWQGKLTAALTRICGFTRDGTDGWWIRIRIRSKSVPKSRVGTNNRQEKKSRTWSSTSQLEDTKCWFKPVFMKFMRKNNLTEVPWVNSQYESEASEGDGILLSISSTTTVLSFWWSKRGISTVFINTDYSPVCVMWAILDGIFFLNRKIEKKCKLSMRINRNMDK